MGFRDMIKDLIQYPSRLLGDNIEDGISMANSGYAKLETKKSNDVQRKDQRVWNSTGTRTIFGIFPPQKAECERKGHICVFDESILGKIFANLGLVDQICFALTCKSLIATYKKMIKNSATNPRQPSMCYLPLSFVNSDDQLRIKLLAQLENSRWVYCAKCFLLKPRRMFKPDAPVALPLKKYCTYHHGVIKLCPCLHFTRRDRENVRILLRSSITFPQYEDYCIGVLTSSLTPPPTNYGCFGLNSNGWICENHTCSSHSSNSKTIEISVTIAASAIGDFDLYVWYSLNTPVSFSDEIGLADPIFACPHMNLLDLIHATGNWTCCLICFAVVWRGPESQEDTGRVTFTTRHDLGHIDLSKPCILSLSSSSSNDDTSIEYVTLKSGIYTYVYVLKFYANFYEMCISRSGGCVKSKTRLG